MSMDLDRYNNIYEWKGLRWRLDAYTNGFKALCSASKCNCEITYKYSYYSDGFEYYIYQCPKCSHKYTLDRYVNEMSEDLSKVLRSHQFENSEVINIDGELIKIGESHKEEDEDYWVRVKLSRNKKDQLQLMVLIGEKGEEEKVQLFIEPATERLSYDQKNMHPSELLSRVVATFKESKTTIAASGSQQKKSVAKSRRTATK